MTTFFISNLTLIFCFSSSIFPLTGPTIFGFLTQFSAELKGFFTSRALFHSIKYASTLLNAFVHH